MVTNTQMEYLDAINHNRAIARGDFDTPSPYEIRKAFKELAPSLASQAQRLIDLRFGKGVVAVDIETSGLEDYFGDLLSDYLSRAEAEREMM